MSNTTIVSDRINFTELPNLSALNSKHWSLPDILLIIIAVIGFVGNFLVCFVFLSIKKLRTTTNLFIVGLAFADLISSLTFFMKAIKVPLGGNIVGNIYCHVIKSDSFVWVCVKVSVLNLVAVTLERLLAIAYAVQHKIHFTRRRAYILLATAWLVAILFSSFSFYRFRFKDGKCVSGWPDRSFKKLVAVVNFLVAYFLPSLFLLFSYLKILNCLNTQGKTILNRSVNSKPSQSHLLFKAKRKTVFVLILVSVTFNVCWTPVHTVFLLNQFGAPLSLESTYFQFFTLLGYSNSCLNPFIYAFMNDHFRKGLVAMVAPNRSRNSVDVLASVIPARQ